MPAAPTAILFDLGSTLIYFEGQWPAVMAQADAALLHALQSAGLALDGPAFLRAYNARLAAYYVAREADCIEHTTFFYLRQLLAELGYADLPEADLRQALAARYAVSRQSWRAESDALPTLQALHAQGYRLGVLSNAGDDADVQALVDALGARPYLDFVLTSATLGVRKPDPRAFQAALQRWDLPPAQAAMVGDTLNADILGAQGLGLLAIWITRRADVPANRALRDTIRPDASLAALSELPGLLKTLTGG
jgi:putative hydrolase of the HAD superfamily